MMSKIVVVDYGLGNLKSVSRAIEYCGGKPEISSDPKIIASAKKIILPGVGAFGEGMKRLKELHLDRAIKDAVENGSYLLGICLGMQMLLDDSEEFGLQEGLGLIKGSVKKIEFTADFGRSNRKIPHIGWSPFFSTPKGEIGLIQSCQIFQKVRQFILFIHTKHPPLMTLKLSL